VCTLKIEVENITVKYNGIPAIEDISFKIEEPGLYALLGPNGAGKTTLMRTILGLVQPAKGRILIDGQDVTGKPSVVGKFASYVPQRPPISKFIPVTPADLVCTAIMVRWNRWPRLRCKHWEKVRKYLTIVGIPPELWDRRLPELSGGMLMRSFLARSIAVGSKMLFLDEPFAPIDPAGRKSIAELLYKLSGDRIVFVSLHDYMLVEKYAKKILLLNKRLIAFGTPEEVLTPTILEKVYGSAVIHVREHVHVADYHWG
jgi:zinc/manganese transport system ATP-binding protein